MAHPVESLYTPTFKFIRNTCTLVQVHQPVGLQQHNADSGQELQFTSSINMKEQSHLECFIKRWYSESYWFSLSGGQMWLDSESVSCCCMTRLLPIRLDAFPCKLAAVVYVDSWLLTLTPPPDMLDQWACMLLSSPKPPSSNQRMGFVLISNHSKHFNQKIICFPFGTKI